MVSFFHPIIIIMASSVATFPLLNASKEDDTINFLKTARALAREENVSLLKYIGGMLRHALRGHDLSKIHFYQDGSGDTYNEDVIDRICEESEADDAAGELKTFDSLEEGLAYLRGPEVEVKTGAGID
jgi:hypothetical protein